MDFRKRVLAAFLALLLMPIPGGSWGYEGHTLVNQVAAGKIPLEMPGFFRKEKKQLAYLGYEPDRWRDAREVSLRDAQGPDHFIDFELVADVAELPRERYSFYKLLNQKRAAALASSTAQPPAKPDDKSDAKSDDKVGANPDDLLPEGVGLQPYITMEVYERLRAAFREYRALAQEKKRTREVEKKIVFYAGWLGHYVADGAQPLHTTIHHHGWVGENSRLYTTDTRIHSAFESAYVAANLKAQDFKDLVGAPVRLADPFADYVKYLRESNQLVEEFYRLERTGAFAGGGTPEGRDFTRRRLAAGSQMLLNLWYTAWRESVELPTPPPYAPRANPTPPTVPMAPPPGTTSPK